MVEKVNYTLLKKIGKIEIRRYPNIIVAQVDGYGDEGFNLLFRYISGANQTKQNIEITAPVISQRIPMTMPVISDQGSIAFVMPSDYILETTPEPLDDRIRIIAVPSRVVAVLKFSGRWSQTIYEARAKELIEELVQYEIKKHGKVFAMRYSGPFTPWFIRKNEVAVEVKT